MDQDELSNIRGTALSSVGSFLLWKNRENDFDWICFCIAFFMRATNFYGLVLKYQLSLFFGTGLIRSTGVM